MADEALIRWEQTRREQLGGAITLLFGLSSASLAFCASLLTHDSIELGGVRSILFLVAVVCFLLALVGSVLATVTRLQDTRTTVRIIRKRLKGGADDELESLRARADTMGRWTWRIFYMQLVTFFVGALFLLLTLYLVFQTKLFPGA